MQTGRTPRVLVAGIAGASLGTEIAKSLHAGGYDILGCDISPLSSGHCDEQLASTYVIGRDSYITDLLELRSREHIDCIVPGDDEPTVLIGSDVRRFADDEIRVCKNNPALIERSRLRANALKFSWKYAWMAY